MISINQIQYFLTIAEIGNMSKAAEKLFMTQPSLSNAISRMENELGCLLFDRIGGNKIVLNKYGAQLYKRLSLVSSQYRMALQEINDMNDPQHGTIRVSTPDICMIESFMADFLAEYPSVRFLHFCFSIDEIENSKFLYDLDFSLNYAPSMDSKLDWEPLLRHPIYALVHRTSPYFGEKTITPEKIAASDLICYCHNDEFPKLCERLLAPHGQSTPVFAGGSLKLTLQALRTNPQSICLISALQFLTLSDSMALCEPSFNKDYQVISIDDPSFDIVLGIITMRGRYMSCASRNALEYLSMRIQEIGAQMEKHFLIMSPDSAPPTPLK